MGKPTVEQVASRIYNNTNCPPMVQARAAARAVLALFEPETVSLAEFVRDGVCLSCGGGVLSSGEHIDPERHAAWTGPTPQTVSAAEELDALPVGSVVTVGHLAYIKRARGVWVGARGLSVGNHTLASYRSAVVRFNPESEDR